jgi:glucose-1-phosphate cytidylyltransferase
MKVVIFCGGLGMRLRDYAENIPKPMVPIGYRPILWHVMKYYAHFGYKDFILCLGYRADAIKHYFLNYDECLSNDFTLSQGGKHLDLFNSDVQDWRITFADTGVTSNIGQRLKAVEKYLKDDEVFLANYSDGLSDVHLPDLINLFEKRKPKAVFLSVKPNLTYHVVSAEEDGVVSSMQPIRLSPLRVNGGFFIFHRDIFKYMREGEELVIEPFQRLIQEQKLLAHAYDGFFATMDTFKDKQQLDDLYASGNAPWELWKYSTPSDAAKPPELQPKPLFGG